MNFIVPERSIFISVSNELTVEQESFVAAIEAMLLKNGLQPMTLGRNIPSNGTPLKTIQTMVSATLGTLVIALIRLRVTSAAEHPLSETPVLGAHRDLPTVWNHIEAAMAYQAEKPLFILAEQGIYPEGIIDPAIYPCLTLTLPSEPEILPAELQVALHRWIMALPGGGRR